MILREKMLIPATPQAVWAVLLSPQSMVLWNEKCTSCETEEDQLKQGLTFPVQFRFKGRIQRAECEVVECRWEYRLQFCFSGGSMPADSSVLETFTLEPHGLETRVTHEVDLTRSGIPWIFRLIIKIIHLAGHPIGPTVLQRLKELVGEAKP